MCKITSPRKREESYPNLIQSLEQFLFPVLSCVGDKGLFMYIRLKHLGLFLQLLKAPRQIIKVNVIRGGVASAQGGCWECVRNRWEFWKSVVVINLSRRSRTWRVTGINYLGKCLAGEHFKDNLSPTLLYFPTLLKSTANKTD